MFYDDAGKRIKLKIERNGIVMNYEFVLEDIFDQQRVGCSEETQATNIKAGVFKMQMLYKSVYHFFAMELNNLSYIELMLTLY